MQNRLIAHQILVQRFGSKLARDLLPFFQQMNEDLKARIAREGDTILTKRKLNALLADSRLLIREILNALDNETQQELLEFIEEEVEFNSTVFKGVEHDLPSPDQVVTAVTNTPMVLNNQAVTMAQAAKNLEAVTIRKVNSFISAGFYQGLTTQEISRNVEIATGESKRNAQTIVRTSTNFLANETRQQVYKRNEDIVRGYIIVATLDFRTSDICKGLDGKKVSFTDKKQPQPPFHFNCRTTTRPLLDEEFDFLQRGATRASKGAEGGKQIPANTTYYEWLKGQPAAMQDQALGKTKGKIFRNAGLTPEEFKQAATDRMNRPLTIKELREESAKIDDYLE